MTELECPKCRCINNREIKGDFGPHKAKIICKECDSFIQWTIAPVELSWKFSFGKYVDAPLEEVLENDISYLKWLMEQDWFERKFPRVYKALEIEGI